MGSIIGHRIDYNGVGALRGQRHIHNKNLPEYPPPPGIYDTVFPIHHLPKVRNGEFTTS